MTLDSGRPSQAEAETGTHVSARATASSRDQLMLMAGEKRADLRPLLRLLPYLLPHRLMLVVAGIALIVAAAMMLLIPLAVRRMIDNGFAAGGETFIAQYFLMLIFIGAVLAAASALRFYCVNWLGERVVAELRADVFRHLAKLGPGYFDNVHSGEVMSRLTADTTQIKSAAGVAISQAVRSTIMTIGALVMMIVTSIELSLLVLVAIPITLVPVIGFGRVVRRLSRTAQDRLADASAYASENLGAIRTMQSFTSEDIVSDRYTRAVEDAFDAARSRLASRAGLTALAMFLVTTCIILVLWLGAWMVIEGELSGGRLGQFVLYAMFVGGSIGQLSEVWGEVQQSAGAAERLSELLDARPTVTEVTHPIAMPDPSEGHIRFENVSLIYKGKDEKPAISNVSFEALPGQKIALVGPSGAGKTSVFSLLLRFYDPSEGTIRVDGADISQVRMQELRDRIAVVPQEIDIFADTVAENIRYGLPSAEREDILKAARIANAHGFISEFVDSYDTRLGERGVQLSGGQRQRLAIARAVLRERPILLLDEATSALDAQSEAAIAKGLRNAMQGRTTLVISHRLATAQDADLILVIDNGRIVERGRHDELIKLNGLYKRFADLQLA
ncbi:MAG: ABC transporter transmembrane domain-containing protein [Pseudomonadota bacterium]